MVDRQRFRRIMLLALPIIGGMVSQNLLNIVDTAMALDPDILYFDQPSAGLDPLSSRRLDDLILELRDSLGTTFVVVTHELASIFAIGDNSVFLDVDTKTQIALGNPRTLRAESPGLRPFEGELLGGREYHILSGVWSARMPIKQANDRAQTALADVLAARGIGALWSHQARALDLAELLASAAKKGNACGPGATAATVAFAREMGCERGRLLAQTSSSEVMRISRAPPAPISSTAAGTRSCRRCSQGAVGGTEAADSRSKSAGPSIRLPVMCGPRSAKAWATRGSVPQRRRAWLPVTVPTAQRASTSPVSMARISRNGR